MLVGPRCTFLKSAAVFNFKIVVPAQLLPQSFDGVFPPPSAENKACQLDQLQVHMRIFFMELLEVSTVCGDEHHQLEGSPYQLLQVEVDRLRLTDSSSGRRRESYAPYRLHRRELLHARPWGHNSILHLLENSYINLLLKKMKAEGTIPHSAFDKVMYWYELCAQVLYPTLSAALTKMT